MCNIDERTNFIDERGPDTQKQVNEHELKIWPKYFNAVLDGSKKDEIRKNDRNYHVGDILFLKEFNPETERFTGRSLKKWVSFIVPGGNFGIDKDFCVMSMKSLKSCIFQGSLEIFESDKDLICKFWDNDSKLCADKDDCFCKEKELFFSNISEIPISRSIWELNNRCPECGRFIENHEIQSAETGFSYCSENCAYKHVNENYIDEWNNDNSNEIIADIEIKFKKSHEVFLEVCLEKYPHRKMKKYTSECKITDNARNGMYDDDPSFPASMCSGDCGNCPHYYEKMVEVEE